MNKLFLYALMYTFSGSMAFAGEAENEPSQHCASAAAPAAAPAAALAPSESPASETPVAPPRGLSLEERLAQDGIHVIKDHGSDIFTTIRRLPSGETAYFGVEPIENPERSQAWDRYTGIVKYLGQDARGPFRIAPLSQEFLEAVLRESWFFEDSEEARKEEFRELIERIPGHKKDQMMEAFRGCASGAEGMHTGIGDFVAYVSKNPITGLCPLPGEDTHCSTADDFQRYDHIVMSVSLFGNRQCPNGTDRCHEHRGIFRNPWSVLRKDYPGIGLLLHGFAATVESHRGDSTYMRVNPDANRLMADMLLDAFDERDMSYARRALVKFPQGANNPIAQASGLSSQSQYIVIKTAALRRLFLESQGRAESKEAESKTP